MNPLALLNPTQWIVSALAVAALVGGVMWWGHSKYQAGVNDTNTVWEARQKAADASLEAERRIQFRQAEIGQKTYEAKVAVVKEDHAKRQAVVDDLQRDVDLLRWAADRRAKEATAATDSCSTDRGRLRDTERLLVESQQRLAGSTRLLEEGAGLVQGLAAKRDLARDWAKAVKLGDEQ